MRIYGIRNRIEQGYNQVNDELGWADFQVRSDTAIRRHHILVDCAFSFCRDSYAQAPPQDADQTSPARAAQPDREGDWKTRTSAHRLLAPSTAASTRPAHPIDHPATLVAALVESATTPATTSPDQRRHHRPGPAPLPPNLTNYR